MTTQRTSRKEEKRAYYGDQYGKDRWWSWNACAAGAGAAGTVPALPTRA